MTEDQLSDIKRLSDTGLFPKQIAVELGLKYHTIYKYCKAMGIPFQGSGGLNRLINSNPFEQWDEVAQYWFGYIAGDGNVSSKKYNIAIYSKDLDHLKKYQDWLGLKVMHIVKDKGTGVVLFGNMETHAWLIERGITPNKSLDLELNIPFTPHIIRGLLDSDGCGRKKGNPTKITSGSTLLLEQLKYHFVTVGIDTVIHLQCERTYCIHIRQQSDKLLYRYLYDNASVFLERKEERLRQAAMR